MTGRSHADYEESSHNEASDPVMKMRNLVTKMAVRQKRREVAGAHRRFKKDLTMDACSGWDSR